MILNLNDIYKNGCLSELVEDRLIIIHFDRLPSISFLILKHEFKKLMSLHRLGKFFCLKPRSKK